MILGKFVPVAAIVPIPLKGLVRVIYLTVNKPGVKKMSGSM